MYNNYIPASVFNYIERNIIEREKNGLFECTT